MKLSKFRMNHNIGVRVTYLRCSMAACPYRCRLLENLNFDGEVPHFEIEVLATSEHNHQVEIARERGMTVLQKNIINLSIERGQAAPKKVFNVMLLLLRGDQRVKIFITN